MREETFRAISELENNFSHIHHDCQVLPADQRVPRIPYGKKLFRVKDNKLQAFIPVESVYVRWDWRTLLRTPNGYELQDPRDVKYFESIDEYRNSEKYNRFMEDGPLVINLLPDITKKQSGQYSFNNYVFPGYYAERGRLEAYVRDRIWTLSVDADGIHFSIQKESDGGLPLYESEKEAVMAAKVSEIEDFEAELGN